ncbi:MAG: hypothetical protein ACYTG6_04880 [Planctomycetota bacterium]|jgi:hypothetical protein
MKLLPVLLLNFATVGGALVVYDGLRNDAPSATQNDGMAMAALERRIEALEAVEPRPTLQGPGVSPLLYERLDALEEALRAQVTTEDRPATERQPASEPTPDERGPTVPNPSSSTPSDEEPTQEEVERFRQLMSAMRREDEARESRRRLGQALDKLSLSLTPREREDVLTAHVAFRSRVQEIWAEVKVQAQATIAAGGQVNRGEIVKETTTLIQQEFAEVLTNVVHPSDAVTIAEALHPIGPR